MLLLHAKRTESIYIYIRVSGNHRLDSSIGNLISFTFHSVLKPVDVLIHLKTQSFAIHIDDPRNYGFDINIGHFVSYFHINSKNTKHIHLNCSGKLPPSEHVVENLFSTPSYLLCFLLSLHSSYPIRRSSRSRLGSLGVTCSPQDPRFAGSNPAEVNGSPVQVIREGL